MGDIESLDELFFEIEKRWGKLDFIVHAIGFSDKSELRGAMLKRAKKTF